MRLALWPSFINVAVDLLLLLSLLPICVVLASSEGREFHDLVRAVSLGGDPREQEREVAGAETGLGESLSRVHH